MTNDEVIGFKSGAAHNKFCVINRNLEHFPGLGNFYGNIIQVKSKTYKSGIACWELDKNLVAYVSVPLLGNQPIDWNPVPDCTLTPLPDLTDEELKENEELFSADEKKELEKVE